MRNNLTAHETPIYKVFSDDYIFKVPSVQRPYAWGVVETSELLDDILEFISHYEISDANWETIEEPYFLGSIVLVKGQGPQASILDGQQRLTTLTILLAVLRDYLGGETGDIESFIVQKGNSILNKQDTFRLHLREKDNDFFNNYIQLKGSTQKLSENTVFKTDSQKAIRDNALYLINRLNNLEEGITRILPKVLATLCYVVIVSTPNFNSAFRIFTVLNDRGLDLLPSDIYKAKVIGNVPEIEQDLYTNKWEEIEMDLGRERFNRLFDYIRMMIQKRKGSSNSKDEYDDIFKLISGKDFIDKILIPYSEIYLNLINYQSVYSKSPQIIKTLSLLNKIDNSDWIAIAMYYIEKNNDKLEEFLILLEQYVGVAMILRKNFNWRMSKYSQILKQMEKGISVFSEESLLRVAPEDKKLLLDKLDGDVYIDLKDTARRYILLRLDSLLTTGQPFYDYSVITVEHVLPQSPPKDSEWLKNFEDPSVYVHKLGNLVLLTRIKNAQAKNYDFEKKKKSYFQSKNGVTTFALTTQVIQETEWTPAILERRQKKMIGLLKNAWGL